MKTNKSMMQAGTAFLLSMFAASVMAAVSPDEAAKLVASLTPFGAEKQAMLTAQFQSGQVA